MGICPRCGSWVDEGEPYCPECCYDGSEDSNYPNVIEVNGFEYDISDVEDALEELGYDLEDFENGLVDKDELEELLDTQFLMALKHEWMLFVS